MSDFTAVNGGAMSGGQVVFVVEHEGYDCGGTRGVFSTRAAALAKCEELAREYNKGVTRGLRPAWYDELVMRRTDDGWDGGHEGYRVTEWDMNGGERDNGTT
jgi:hypothetical protein